jgi:hypothetical protein
VQQGHDSKKYSTNTHHQPVNRAQSLSRSGPGGGGLDSKLAFASGKILKGGEEECGVTYIC